jgi:long-chain acyl-CoA synthetase
MWMMKRETLLDFFEDLAGLEGEFLVWDDGYRARSWSYGQTADAARAFAAQTKLAKADKVLVWAENRPEWIAVFWGCLLQGAVPVPVDYRASAEFLARIQIVAQARLLVMGDDVPEAPPLGIAVWRLRDLQWSGGASSRASVSRDDIAEVLFTSGATADPKGVIITHRNILANIVAVEQEVHKYVAKYRLAARLLFPIRFLNLLPLSHMFGQSMATFVPPMLPGTVFFTRGFSPTDILRLIRKRHISVLVCVPRMLEVLREYARAELPDRRAAGGHAALRWWRYRRIHRLFGLKFWAFVVGAAPLDPELEAFWQELGFVVIQGYGLTETAPIVTLNHPFRTKPGTVGTPIAGVEVKISPEGEILVRGENVTSGYLNGTASLTEDGWLRTGDAGVIDDGGRLQVRGRLNEMIVTPEGMNVFPADVERVLDRVPGVKESAVVGDSAVHAVLVLDNGSDAEEIIRRANAQLEAHQRIRGFTVWASGPLPRTEGTRKLKRHEIQAWVASGGTAKAEPRGGAVEDVLARYAPGRRIDRGTTLAELGLSSLERVELLIALEQRLGTTIDEGAFASACTAGDLEKIAEAEAAPAAVVNFPRWNRGAAARLVRRTSLPTWVLPTAAIFSRVKAHGLEHLRKVEPPVIFASNHQSHLDVPSILLALPRPWRYRLAPAMSKEFFRAHFYPDAHKRSEWFTNTLNYYLASLMFNAFPLPQRETGARETVRYAGELAQEGWCVLIFPEGKISETGEIGPFMPGVGLLASRLRLPVVPVRLEGLTSVLHRSWKFPRRGRVSVTFGAPLSLEGEDYVTMAARVREAVVALTPSAACGSAAGSAAESRSQ